MSKGIGYFRVDIEPWSYASPYGPETNTIRVTVEYNGTRYGQVEVLPNVRPFETELEYFTGVAVRALHAAMKEQEENKGKPRPMHPELDIDANLRIQVPRVRADRSNGFAYWVRAAQGAVFQLPWLAQARIQRAGHHP